METTTAIKTVESRMITLQERCAKLDCYNPAAIGKTFAMVRTMNDCLAIQDAGEPVLRAITRQGESKRVELSALIALNVAALDRFLHLKNPLSEDETDFIAEQIIDEFGCAMTMADLFVVFRNAKAGVYGKFYERLSAPEILGWFREYYENRMNAAEERNLMMDRKQYGQPEVRMRVKSMSEAAASSEKNNEYMTIKSILIQNGYKLNQE